MLDLNLIRENPDLVRTALKNRQMEPSPVDDILRLDEKRRTLLTEVERLKAERNAVSKEIGRMKDAAEREQKIIAMIEKQHRSVIWEIKGGKYDKQAALMSDPLAEGIIDTKKSLDQVILDYLASEEEKERLVLQLQGTQEFIEGAPCTLNILTKSSADGQPLKGAKIVVKIISTIKKPITVYEGKTDRNGILIVEFVVPDFPDGNAALLIQAFSDNGSDEIKQLLKKKKKVASPPK